MTPTTSYTQDCLLPAPDATVIAASVRDLQHSAKAAGEIVWAMVMGGLALWAWTHTWFLP